MAVYSRNSFPALKSTPNWFWTWFLRCLFGTFFALLALVFFAEPLLLYYEDYIYGSGAIIFMVFYYPLILWACFAIFRHIKKARLNYIANISVDEKGVHFYKINGEVESILYSKLQRSNNGLMSDVSAKTMSRYSPTLLYVHVNGSEQSIYFNKTDVFFSYYTGNYKKLRSHFIQGVQIFRPDLKISPGVFSAFHIHSETFEFDKKEFTKTIIAVIVLLILIVIGIVYWMNYRFATA